MFIVFLSDLFGTVPNALLKKPYCKTKHAKGQEGRILLQKYYRQDPAAGEAYDAPIL